MTTPTTRTPYPTDLTDTQWEQIAPLLQRPKPKGGRPVEVDLREIVNALLYLNRTGCQWRMIPREFPKKGAVRYYFDKWTEDGTLIQINDHLREMVRTALEREPTPSIGVLDSQSVKTTEAGGDCGYDAGKKKSRGANAKFWWTRTGCCSAPWCMQRTFPTVRVSSGLFWNMPINFRGSNGFAPITATKNALSNGCVTIPISPSK